MATKSNSTTRNITGCKGPQDLLQGYRETKGSQDLLQGYRDQRFTGPTTGLQRPKVHRTYYRATETKGPQDLLQGYKEITAYALIFRHPKNLSSATQDVIVF